MFHGTHMNLGTISRLSSARTRMVTAENVYGKQGMGGMAEVSDTPQEDVVKIGQEWEKSYAARELGKGWKTRPAINMSPRSTAVIMDADGPGVIQHIWITVDEKWLRDLVLRIYWDGETEPSVETPVGDFFCNGFRSRTDIMALPLNVNPSGGMNCYFPMPFRRHARITVENLSGEKVWGFFYAITYAETEVAEDEGYFHASFRRTNPLPYLEPYTIIDGISGKGHYVGTYMAWQQNSTGWWGEGEIKFFMDGDTEYPTLCGTGTEDYFGGAWSFGRNYSAPFLGYPAGSSDGSPGNRHSLYRFHIMDPVRFEQELKVTMQALGWRSESRYLPLQDDISSVAYWYQAEPHRKFLPLPDRNGLEVI